MSDGDRMVGLAVSLAVFIGFVITAVCLLAIGGLATRRELHAAERERVRQAIERWPDAFGEPKVTVDIPVEIVSESPQDARWRQITGGDS